MHINLFRQRLADFFIELLPKFTAKIVPGFVRVSFSLENSETDAEYLIQVLNAILEDTKSSAFDKFLSSTHNGTPWLPPFEEHTDIQEFITQRIARVFPETE